MFSPVAGVTRSLSTQSGLQMLLLSLFLLAVTNHSTACQVIATDFPTRLALTKETCTLNREGKPLFGQVTNEKFECVFDPAALMAPSVVQ